MTFFANSKHKQKKILNVHDNIMKFKVHDKLNLILIQQLDEEDWINSIYIQYITYSFWINSIYIQYITYSFFDGHNTSCITKKR
jgi:hypothetical protein